mgnify:CR=1 FL=1
MMRLLYTLVLYLLMPLVLLGVLSVWYWYFTESTGHGDLRAYGLVLRKPMFTDEQLTALTAGDDFEVDEEKGADLGRQHEHGGYVDGMSE